MKIETDSQRINRALSAFEIAADFPRALLRCRSGEFWMDAAGHTVVVRVGWTALPLFTMNGAEAVAAWISSQEGLRQIIVPEPMAAPVWDCAKTLGAREPVVENLADMRELRGALSAEPVLRATAADRERLAALYPPARFNVVEFLPYEKRFELALKTGRIYYVERNGRPVAACHTIAEGAGIAMIMGVVTDPAWRKNGFARSAVSLLCRDLLKGGLQPRLMFEDNNAITRALYESLGFTGRTRFSVIDFAAQPATQEVHT